MANYIQQFKQKPDDVTIAQAGGENEQQAETGAFLGQALVIALMTDFADTCFTI